MSPRTFLPVLLFCLAAGTLAQETDDLVSSYYGGRGGVTGQAVSSVTVTTECGTKTWAETDWPGAIALRLEGLDCDSGGLRVRGLKAGAWYWTRTSPPVAAPLLPASWLRGEPASVPGGLDEVDSQERGTYMELLGNAVIVPHIGLLTNGWRGLTIADEDRCSDYRSDDYSYPQSVEADIVDELGGIFSPYTCESFASTRDTDIEHIVARSEAHDSGLCGADAATRRRFAEDLRNLTLAAPTLNRNVKGAKDAAEWMPDQNRCWFAQRVLDVKRAYALTIDQAEAGALERVLATCTSTTIQCSVGPGNPPGADPDPPPVQTYANCTALKEAGWDKGVNENGGTYQWRSWDVPEEETYDLNTSRDRDKDGHACE